MCVCGGGGVRGHARVVLCVTDNRHYEACYWYGLCEQQEDGRRALTRVLYVWPTYMTDPSQGFQLIRLKPCAG